MIIDKEQVKRLGVFFFFDKDGIADRYVEYLISEFAKCQDKLIIVSNGEVSGKTKKMFFDYTENVIIRENKGLDVAAYLAAFQSLGWEKMETYDEITIMNFTLMGPVYPLEQMYHEMEQKDVDFWGISKHFKFDHDLLGNIPYGYLPEHIQSHFMVFRSSLVKSEEFQDFWNHMPKIEDYRDSVAMFEATFTKKFSDYGFKWEVYSTVDDMKGVSYNPIMEYPKELVKNRKCPFFKRRSFFQEQHVVLDTTLGESASDLFYFLEKETSYDTGMIWENIIRSCNHTDFVRSLHLNYILSTENVDDTEKDTGIKIVLIMHLYHKEQLKRSLHYANQLPGSADILILTRSEDVVYYKENFKTSKGNNLKIIEYEGTEAECFLEISKKIRVYDIGCYYHDSNGNVVKNSFYYKNTENLLFNDIYVRNIIKTFNHNKYVGLLVPPEPNHAGYFATMGREWNGYFKDTVDIMKRLEIQIPVTESKEPVSPLGSMFWFRTSAILDETEALIAVKNDYNAECFQHIWKRLLPFICLKNGYFPAYVLTDYFGRIELTNLNFYLREYGKFLERNGVVEGTQKEMIRKLEAKFHGQEEIMFVAPGYMKFAYRMQKLLPKGLYDRLIRVKRKIFGPYDLE